METTSENINSVPIEGTEMFTFKPSPPPRNYTTGEIADTVAKLALKKLMWYIAKYLLIGAAIVALSLLGLLIF